MKIYSGTAYKFMSIDGLIATIENESIRFTRGDMFNDPFESNPYLVPLNWSDEIPKFDDNPDLHLTIYTHAFHRIFSDFYFTCFTKSYKDEDSKLMWTHYANNHSAACIELEIDEKFDDFLRPIEINYVENLVEERNKISPESDEKILSEFLFTTKSITWKYEKEIRFVLLKSAYEDFNQKKIETSEDKTFAYLPFDISKIKRIIFGVKTEINDSIKIYELLKAKNVKIQFSKLEICPHTLKLKENAKMEEYFKKMII